MHAEGAGCYGHNGADDVAFDAALLARAANGRPVRVQWMRDDEFMWEPYGAAMTMRVKAAGAMRLTLMPCATPAVVRLRVSPMTAALAVA